jgi:DNA-binding CsgD family transcriptional regulator
MDELECRPRGPEEPVAAVPVRLSPRETEVVALVVEGLTNAQAGVRLGVSIRTVQSHVASALEKTSTRSRVQLAVFALCSGLVPCPCAHRLSHQDRQLGTSAD